jgi:isocitrate dehydrogenase
MLVSKETEQEKIIGVDIFIESSEQPNAVAEKCLRHTQDLFKLVTISNRGTQVWPKGSVFTNLVNQFRCRFESVDEAALTQTDIIELYKLMTKDFKVCSTEVLNMWGGKRSYSLAQGQ